MSPPETRYAKSGDISIAYQVLGALWRQGPRATHHARGRARSRRDYAGADTWRRIIAAVEELANTTPPGPLH
jgi:hypothetical protein